MQSYNFSLRKRSKSSVFIRKTTTFTSRHLPHLLPTTNVKVKVCACPEMEKSAKTMMLIKLLICFSYLPNSLKLLKLSLRSKLTTLAISSSFFCYFSVQRIVANFVNSFNFFNFELLYPFCNLSVIICNFSMTDLVTKGSFSLLLHRSSM